MAVREIVERHFLGFAESGEREYSATFTGRREPETLEDWLGMREHALRPFAGTPAARAVVGLLRAGSPGEVKAAVSQGHGMDAHTRHAVWRTLEVCRDKARDFTPALPVAEAACHAWRAKWGDQPPRTAS